VVELVERQRVLEQVTSMLDRAGAGSGGVLVVAGPPGSGRTAVADAAVERARTRGFDVLRATPIAGRQGRSVWAQLLRDAGGPDELAQRLLAEAGQLDLDAAAALLCSGGPRLLVVDDFDRGGRRRWPCSLRWQAGSSPLPSRCW
jgi:hypothetical protein